MEIEVSKSAIVDGAQIVEERAREFARLLVHSAMDYSNIVLSGLHFDELRPLIDSDIGDKSWALTNTSRAGLYNYEDSGMTTGGFLASQSLRYAVTEDPEAKHFADLAFSGIRNIYELGCEKQEGYFPKPYNGQNSNQISRDQYLFAIHGMLAYHKIAEPSAQDQIVNMICRMADYWIDIDYTHLYYDLPPFNQLKDPEGSLFLGIIGPAYFITGERKYKDEYYRLFNDLRLAARMPETLTDLFREGKTFDGGMYYRSPEHTMMMKSMAIDGIWVYENSHHDIWTQSLEHFWHTDLRRTLDRPSGTTYSISKYGRDNNLPVLTEPGVISELENPLNLATLTWGGLRRTAGSSQVAYVSSVTASRLKFEEAREVAWDILLKLSLEKFRGWTVPTQEHLPPGHEWQTSVLNTGYLAYWQWAYWLGRWQNLW
jgi:hypothetical protein